MHSFLFLLSLRSELQDTVADLRAQLQSQAGQLQSQAGQLDSAAALEDMLTEQQREMDQLHSQLLEQQQTSDGLQREATLAHIQLEESREAFRVRIQHCMLEVCLPTGHQVEKFLFIFFKFFQKIDFMPRMYMLASSLPQGALAACYHIMRMVLVRLGVLWYGLSAWSGLNWSGLVRSGVVWHCMITIEQITVE